IVRAALLRTLVLPPLSVAGFLPAALLALLPAVSEGFDAQRLVAVVDDEIVPPGISPLAWVALSAVMAVAASILAGLAVIVVVVMPIVAFFMPQVLIRQRHEHSSRASASEYRRGACADAADRADLRVLAPHHGRRHPRCPLLGRDGGAARDSRPDLVRLAHPESRPRPSARAGHPGSGPRPAPAGSARTDA